MKKEKPEKYTMYEFYIQPIVDKYINIRERILKAMRLLVLLWGKKHHSSRVKRRTKSAMFPCHRSSYCSLWWKEEGLEK